MAQGSLLSAPIAASSSGDNTIVAAVTNKRIVVVGYVLIATGTVTVKWYNGASSGSLNLSGGMQLTAQAGAVAPLAPQSEFGQGGWFQTSIGSALILNLSGATEIDGHLAYYLQS